MKIFVFALLFIAVTVSADTIEERWNKYKVDFERNFSPEEDKERFEIFKNRVLGIDSHNAKYEKGEVTYTQGINAFTDRKDHERPGFMGGVILPGRLPGK